MENRINAGISNIPHTRLNQVGFRTITSSENHNDNQDKILDDIIDLYNKANNIEKKLTESLQIANCENRYLDLKIRELTEKLNNINSSKSTALVKTVSVYPNKVRTPMIYPAKIDNITSDITITPIVSSSKVRIEDSDMENIFIPPSLNVSLSDIKATGIVSVEDSDVRNAFNGKRDSIWLRRVVTNNSITSIETTMTITLPEDVVTTYNINEIKLCTFPLNTIDIVSVKYRISNGAWKDIPSFKEHTSSTNGIIKSAPNVKFNFSDIVANQIQIVFKQNNHVTENSKRVFYLGCSEIDIRGNRYDNYSNHIEFDIEIPNDITKPVITDVSAIYNNASELSGNAVQYEFFYIGTDNLMHKVRERFPFISPSNKLIAKCKIFNGNSTPNISRFDIKYKQS